MKLGMLFILLTFFGSGVLAGDIQDLADAIKGGIVADFTKPLSAIDQEISQWLKGTSEYFERECPQLPRSDMERRACLLPKVVQKLLQREKILKQNQIGVLNTHIDLIVAKSAGFDEPTGLDQSPTRIVTDYILLIEVLKGVLGDVSKFILIEDRDPHLPYFSIQGPLAVSALDQSVRISSYLAYANALREIKQPKMILAFADLLETVVAQALAPYLKDFTRIDDELKKKAIKYSERSRLKATYSVMAHLASIRKEFYEEILAYVDGNSTSTATQITCDKFFKGLSALSVTSSSDLNSVLTAYKAAVFVKTFEGLTYAKPILSESDVNDFLNDFPDLKKQVDSGKNEVAESIESFTTFFKKEILGEMP